MTSNHDPSLSPLTQEITRLEANLASEAAARNNLIDDLNEFRKFFIRLRNAIRVSLAPSPTNHSTDGEQI